ncbi:MAG: energy transducer TonB [Acidobacteria bacterium]|nr:energy transducer TonB [Acidobacteriota bacterium]
MARDLFDDVVSPSVRVGTHPWYSVPLSIVTHALLVAALMIVPFVSMSVFPTPERLLAFAPPPTTPVPPPPALEVATVPPSLVKDILLPDAAPLEAAETITEPPPAILTAPMSQGRELQVRPGADIARHPPAGTATLVEPPPPPPASTGPIRVGGAVREPRKLRHVPPVYPALARAARREGTVILEATVARDGRVIDARVLRSSDMFDQAAIEAVRQWRYTVPTLNGVPVDVTMTVTVRFTLN